MGVPGRPGYRADWDGFWRTWQALEADCGAPPQDDLAALAQRLRDGGYRGILLPGK